MVLQGPVRVGQHLHALHAELGGSRAKLALPDRAERAPGRRRRIPDLPCSPRLAETIMTSAPASAAQAIVPAAQNTSSSGCAKTPSSRRAELVRFSTMTSSEPWWLNIPAGAPGRRCRLRDAVVSSAHATTAPRPRRWGPGPPMRTRSPAAGRERRAPVPGMRPGSRAAPGAGDSRRCRAGRTFAHGSSHEHIPSLGLVSLRRSKAAAAPVQPVSFALGQAAPDAGLLPLASAQLMQSSARAPRRASRLPVSARVARSMMAARSSRQAWR